MKQRRWTGACLWQHNNNNNKYGGVYVERPKVSDADDERPMTCVSDSKRAAGDMCVRLQAVGDVRSRRWTAGGCVSVYGKQLAACGRASSGG